jgi:thioredoxin reductase
MAKKAVNIENYPGLGEISGLDLIQKIKKQLTEHPVDIEINAIKSVARNGKFFSVETVDKKKFESKTLIVASGADPRPLEIPGEKEFVGKGVSYCVACDGPLYAGQKVAVIGGGNAGLEAALSLSSYAEQVYVLEFNKNLKAEQTIIDQIGKIKNITIITQAAVEKIQGSNFMESIVYRNTASQEKLTLEVKGLFVEIGSQPATSFIKGLVDFNEKDEIIVDAKTGGTNTPGLFAAGDVDCIPYKQIVIACGEGAKAAISVSIYLQKNDWT